MRIRTAAVLLAAAIVGAGATAAMAADLHYHYPKVPYGRAQIVDVFGRPCNARARENAITFKAADDGRLYTVRYHRKLGGAYSSVLPDVRWHILNSTYPDNLKRGIWGYACRYIANTRKYSTHAWGIAVDINSAYEHVGHYHCHSIPDGLGRIWTNHGFKWGVSFGDCMHFQYATGY